jgi:hypothetical protein
VYHFAPDVHEVLETHWPWKNQLSAPDLERKRAGRWPLQGVFLDPFPAQ